MRQMKPDTLMAIGGVIMLIGIGFLWSAFQPGHHWSMVYEAVQTPEQPGGLKRFVLFNEDDLSEQECIDLFNEHLRRLNNNGAVIEYKIGCDYLQTKGHGTNFQRQMHWMIP